MKQQETNSLIYGQKVTVSGKRGTIREVADKVKVRFEDGTWGFFDYTEIVQIDDPTYMKQTSRYERMKEQSKIKPDQTFMTPVQTGGDPLAQPINRTGRGIGDKAMVLGR